MPHNHNQVKQKQEEIAQTWQSLIGTTWKHYKGEIYHITDIVMAESDEETFICYNSVDEPLPLSWCRPLKEWIEQIYYNDENVQRFQRI